MKLTEATVSELLAAFRSSEPTPGGGSAAALAGAVGASLLAMVAGLPKPRAAESADLDRLEAAGAVPRRWRSRSRALIDEDSAAYSPVVDAFRLPKSSDEEKAARSAAIQRALTAATEAPLRVMRHCGRRSILRQRSWTGQTERVERRAGGSRAAARRLAGRAPTSRSISPA